jgi:hypothetical protein
MPETGGRGAGEGRQNPKGVVDATEARYRWSYLPGEPDALKGARPVCAVRRVVISLLEAGGIEEVFLGYQSTRMRKLKGTRAD